MKTRILVAAIVILTLFPVQAHAIENGDDAAGIGFVVPILIDKGNGQRSSCSGALIAPSIVVTAGHCVVDAMGVATKNVYVGQAGSALSSITNEDKIFTIQITSTFKNTPIVDDDDLAFLTLGKSQALPLPVVIASEKQLTEFKNSKASLKAFGYGKYGDTSTVVVTTPRSMEGIFSNIPSFVANSAYMTSTKASSCKGDSGAPILNITATQVTIVGIIAGGAASVNCSKKASDGTYRTIFTLIGRYANLAFSAAIDVMDTQSQKILSDRETLLALANKLNDATISNIQALSDLDEAKATIVELNKKLPQTITCVKGKLSKKVTAVNPKCPAGYKKK
jgi:secreted trypsin-like serine protease